MRIKKKVEDQQNIEKIWHNKINIVIYKISIVSLNFFVIRDLYFSKAKSLYKNLLTIFSRLHIINFFNNFIFFFFNNYKTFMKSIIKFI